VNTRKQTTNCEEWPMSIEKGTKGENKDGYHEQQLVVFKVADEEFGVDINEVKEIIRWEEVTRIPNAAPYIKGVINLRGNIIVVNDLAMKLGLPSKKVDDDTRILVVEVGDNNTVGMVVDSATEVLRLSGDKIRAAPSMVTSNIDSNYIEGVGLLDEKRLLTLLDLSKVLESEDYGKIMAAQKIAEQNIMVQQEPTHGSEENEPTTVETIQSEEETKKNESSPPQESTMKKETSPLTKKEQPSLQKTTDKVTPTPQSETQKTTEKKTNKKSLKKGA
jgi:purine-binding chemotaxis protein CheW